MRCPWPGTDPLYVAYHDEEWGVPEFDSRALFEKLILDGFQAGLSWITILRKRDAFRTAFANFDPEKIARVDAKKIAAMMDNPGIIRNRADQGHVKRHPLFHAECRLPSRAAETWSWPSRERAEGPIAADISLTVGA